MKLKTGDEVLVLRGKDKGKKGKIDRVFGRRQEILVAGINIYKKHVKKSKKTPGGIMELFRPLPVSKVALVCPKCNLATKVQIASADNKKIRICKKCKQQI